MYKMASRAVVTYNESDGQYSYPARLCWGNPRMIRTVPKGMIRKCGPHVMDPYLETLILTSMYDWAENH